MNDNIRNMEIPTKEKALDRLAKYVTNRMKGGLHKNMITDKRPDWFVPYGISDEDDYWYCFPEKPYLNVGATRVVIISKSTGKVVYDAHCGE
ncbi:MAG: hypothetical protein JW932_19745 [Deltaproteobacteria bacterium]|nr:hypothetical protein [Deltaproteobacteria bacterium]